MDGKPMTKCRRLAGTVVTALLLGCMLVYATVVRDWLGVALVGGFLAVTLMWLITQRG